MRSSMKVLLLAAVAIVVVSGTMLAHADGATGPATGPYHPVCSAVNRTHDGFLALRAGPGSSFPMLAQLYSGDVVFETGEYASNWVHINYTLRGGQLDGCVHGNYTVNVECPDIAMPLPPPPVPVQVPVPVPVPAPYPTYPTYPTYSGYPQQQQQNGPVVNNNVTITTSPPVIVNNNNNNR